jgi:hypothetical protein
MALIASTQVFISCNNIKDIIGNYVRKDDHYEQMLLCFNRENKRNCHLTFVSYWSIKSYLYRYEQTILAAALPLFAATIIRTRQDGGTTQN